MSRYQVYLTIVLALSVCIPAYANDNATKTYLPQTKPQKAHDFFAYLVRLGVVNTDTKTKCGNGEVIPDTTDYMQEVCASILRVSYSCNKGKETYTSETRIDWRYISETKINGYSHDGEEIEIFGNVTTSHTKGMLTKKQKAKPGKQTRKIRLKFDSPATAKRALNAFTLLKNKCDTSTDYPF